VNKNQQVNQHWNELKYIKYWFSLFPMKQPGVDFIKQFTAYAWNFQSGPILDAHIYSNLASWIYILRSTFCIFSQILGKLYDLPCAPNFYEIHPYGEIQQDWNYFSIVFNWQYVNAKYLPEYITEIVELGESHSWFLSNKLLFIEQRNDRVG
jgi:hypothetical protein